MRPSEYCAVEMKLGFRRYWLNHCADRSAHDEGVVLFALYDCNQRSELRGCSTLRRNLTGRMHHAKDVVAPSPPKVPASDVEYTRTHLTALIVPNSGSICFSQSTRLGGYRGIARPASNRSMQGGGQSH